MGTFLAGFLVDLGDGALHFCLFLFIMQVERAYSETYIPTYMCLGVPVLWVQVMSQYLLSLASDCK